MMSVLWQFGILAAILVFGIKVGLASGLANLSKKLLAIICVGYGGGFCILYNHGINNDYCRFNYNQGVEST